MSIIKFINEENGQTYDTEDSVYNLIYYIFDSGKTMYDEVRPGKMLGEFVGCSRFLGSESQEKDESLVATLMIVNNKVYGKNKGNLLKHRVISFEEMEYVLPIEAFQLAQYLANAYGENYITAFGVHLDKKNVHIHLAIDTVSWRDGKRFSISYEKRWLSAMVGNWQRVHDENLFRNMDALKKHEKYVGHY